MFEEVRDLDIFYPSLFSRYINKEQDVLQYFSAPYPQEESYEKLVGQLKVVRAGDLPGFLDTKPGESLILPGTRLLEKKFRDNQTLFVITGQQPGLLTGPLYSIYKALTAVKLADRLEERLNKPVQPLFWVASEDHNVFNLLRLFLLNPQGKISRVRLAFPGFGPPAGEITLHKKDMVTVLDRLEEITPKTHHKDEVMSALRDITAQSSTLTDWFVYLMQFLFHRRLGFIDPLRLSKNGAYTPLLLKTLEMGPQIHRCIDQQEKKLMESGFSPQVKRTGQESFIMIVWKGRRYALYRDKDTFYTSKGELSLTRYELTSMIHSEPGCFSPNVLLRPIFQDSLFPNLAYVAGPGELAYFAQIKGVYRLFGIPMPVVFPRQGATLVTSGQEAFCREQGLTLHDALQYARLVCENPEKKEGESWQMEKVREFLWPRCSPQERVFNIFPFMLEHGLSFWKKFSTDFPAQEGHYIYYLRE